MAIFLFAGSTETDGAHADNAKHKRGYAAQRPIRPRHAGGVLSARRRALLAHPRIGRYDNS